jgi:hypothetical protein
MLKIEKKDAEFLKELSKKINTQNKRCTAYVMFMIYDKVKVYRGNEGSEIERKDMDYVNSKDLCDSCAKLYEDGDELPETCDDCDPDCFYTFDWEEQPQDEYGVYFTAEACERAILRYGHHFNQAFSFGISAYHSEEMKRVMDIISKLTLRDGEKNPLK